ncbi:MAG: SH3 domain-containing protein [Chloroflexi bacterium]|nr:SH3 domain-containing protein [Chloroflexota bacterium]
MATASTRRSPTRSSLPAIRPQTGVVSQSEATLRLRAEPNVLSTQIGRIPWGDLLPILEQTRDGWYKVIWRGTVGWVASGFVKIIEGEVGVVPMR